MAVTNIIQSYVVWGIFPEFLILRIVWYLPGANVSFLFQLFRYLTLICNLGYLPRVFNIMYCVIFSRCKQTFQYLTLLCLVCLCWNRYFILNSYYVWLVFVGMDILYRTVIMFVFFYLNKYLYWWVISLSLMDILYITLIMFGFFFLWMNIYIDGLFLYLLILTFCNYVSCKSYFKGKAV